MIGPVDRAELGGAVASAGRGGATHLKAHVPGEGRVVALASRAMRVVQVGGVVGMLVACGSPVGAPPRFWAAARTQSTASSRAAPSRRALDPVVAMAP